MGVKKNILQITQIAASKARELLDQRGKESLGIRVGVKQGGCSGLKYFIEYVDSEDKYDEVIELESIKVFISPKAIMYLLGTIMDYVDTDVKSGFVFKNPNEKGGCGCGESFHV
jgi:iron-sulfur cluster assembly protein